MRSPTATYIVIGALIVGIITAVTSIVLYYPENAFYLAVFLGISYIAGRLYMKGGRW